MDRTKCSCCGEHLAAPEWSERESETTVRELWSCAECGNTFEVVVQADPAKMPDALIEQFLPNLVVE